MVFIYALLKGKSSKVNLENKQNEKWMNTGFLASL